MNSMRKNYRNRENNYSIPDFSGGLQPISNGKKKT